MAFAKIIFKNPSLCHGWSLKKWFLKIKFYSKNLKNADLCPVWPMRKLLCHGLSMGKLCLKIQMS